MVANGNTEKQTEQSCFFKLLKSLCVMTYEGKILHVERKKC